MKCIKGLLLYTCIVLLLGGCAKNLTSTVAPGATFNEFGETAVVRFDPDKRNLNYIIADQLTLLGYPAVAVEPNDVPENIDTLVTYRDNWQWDMSNYMIKLNIKFRDGETGELIASGESFRTSMVRTSPENMIKETLGKILEKKNGNKALVVNVEGCNVDNELLIDLSEEVENALISDGFKICEENSQDIYELNIKVTDFDAGNGFLRAIIGFGVGKAVMHYDIEFKDDSGVVYAEKGIEQDFSAMEISLHEKYGAKALGGKESARIILIEEAADNVRKLAHRI